MSPPATRVVALVLAAVVLAGAVAATPAALDGPAVDAGAATQADATPPAQTGASAAAQAGAAASQANATPGANLTVAPADAGAASTHIWSFDDVNYTGEVDAITVDYPVGTSFQGLTEANVTVEITREGEAEPTEISVNSDEYAGSSATFDLSGVYDTGVAGPVSVTVADVGNPAAGNYAATLTFDGDDTVTAEAEFAVTGEDDGSAPVGADLALDPDTAGAESTHTWSLDGLNYDGEVDTVTVDYPGGTSLDGLTDEDVTVEITREGESEPTDVAVNSGEYAGSSATFDLSGVYDTGVAGPVSVTIDGVGNPGAGEETALVTFDGDDTVTAEADFAVAEPTSTLAADVLDAAGEPLGNATVAVELDGPADDVVLAETDADGTATVDVPEDGEYAVTVTAPGEGATTGTVAVDGTAAATFALGAGETGTVQALVTDAEGEPLPEGTWTTLRGDGLDAPVTGQVDADGVVTLDGVAPGEYSLQASTLARGVTDARDVTVTAGGTTTTEFTYGEEPTTATLAGSVATPDGDALANATVVVEYVGIGGGGIEDGVATVETDADGEFAVPFVPAGFYVVTVAAQDYAPGVPAFVNAAAGEHADVTLAERESGSISGVVTDADGEALPEGTWVSFAADGFETDRTVELGPGGTFDIDNVAPGSYDVVAETRNHGTTGEHKVNVANGETGDVEISYAEDDSPGEGPPDGTPGEGPPWGGPDDGSPGDEPGEGPPWDEPGGGPPWGGPPGGGPADWPGGGPPGGGPGDGPPSLAPVHG